MMILRWFKYLPLLVAIFVVSNVIACSGSGDSYPSPVSYASAIGNWEANAEGIKWLADPFKTGKLSVQELNCCEIQTIDGQGGAFVASGISENPVKSVVSVLSRVVGLESPRLARGARGRREDGIGACGRRRRHRSQN